MRYACILAIVTLGLAGCRDVARFSSRGDRFEGDVVRGSFVRAGIGEDVKMCLTLDTDRLQDAPGHLTTSDGRFRAAPLRPIPQVWHDPLSTLEFGLGRVQNLLYMAAPEPSDAGGAEPEDVLVVVSLMRSEHVEVRLLRGAPEVDAGLASSRGAAALFGVFDLARREGPCAL